jgi:hypothetical protein
MYLPVTSKLSLQKNKKKRDLKRSNNYDDDTLGPLKLSESLPDRFIIGARGYTENEVKEHNQMIKNGLQGGSEIVSGHIFRDKEEAKGLEKNEARYLKELFKK